MEIFIICFLIVAIAASVYFFKSVVLGREVRQLRRRYRTNDGTDLRVAYDEMIEEHNSIVRRSNALIKKYNANINDYNQLLARHRANLNNQPTDAVADPQGCDQDTDRRYRQPARDQVREHFAPAGTGRAEYEIHQGFFRCHVVRLLGRMRGRAARAVRVRVAVLRALPA